MSQVKFYFEEFKNIRIKKRWTINALSEECGITRQTLSLWERGKVTPSEGRILQLAKLLDINPSDISNTALPISISERDLTPLVSSAISCMNQNNILRQQDGFIQQLTDHFKEYSQLSILMKALLDTMHSLLYVKDINLKYLMANKSFIENIGLKEDFSAIGKNDYDFFQKREATANSNEDEEILRTGKEIVNNERYIIGSKKARYGLCSKYPIYDNGKIIGILCHITDITEQKKSEFLNNIINETINRTNVSLGVYDLTNNKFIYSAGAGSGNQIFGGYPSDIKGNDTVQYWLNHIVHPDDKEEQLKYIADLSKLPPKRTYRIIHPQKGIRIIQVTTSETITFLKRKYITSLSTDITDQK